MEYTFLQTYWWLIVSVLGAALVFMLFVNGGQTLLVFSRGKASRGLMLESLGSKWELTFTTLVMFGGAAFAAFPLFYSTSFGGAYWLWMLILLCFVVQPVGYGFGGKRGNLFGDRTYQWILALSGGIGCLLLGVAVGMMFFGGHFTVERTNILDSAAPVISQWAPSHGFEAICNWRCLLFGCMVLFLTRTLGALYFVNNISDDRDFGVTMRNHVLTSGTIFALLFVSFVIVLLRFPALRQVEPGVFAVERFGYLHQLLEMWWIIPVIVVGAVCVLWGIYRTAFSTSWRNGIWFAGIGTVLVVMALFWLAGFGNTPYLPSITDPASSLTISNSSSTRYTLETMAWASLVIPVVLAYIIYVWARMNAKPLTTGAKNDK